MTGVNSFGAEVREFSAASKPEFADLGSETLRAKRYTLADLVPG